MLPIEGEPLLWLAADAALKTDAEGGVFAWGDISTAVDENRYSAWQVEPHRRPKLIDRGIGGASWLRFDGDNDCLVTEPFANGDAQTIAAVFRLNSLARPPGDIAAQQVINYNGQPYLVVDYRIWSKVIRAQAFAGVGERPAQTGRLRASGVEKGETYAVIYTYDYHANRAAHYLNHEPQGTSTAAFGVASDRPKVIGAHRRLAEGGLNGDLAELILFDRALSDEEVTSLSGYLEGRYDSLSASREASHRLGQVEPALLSE